MSHPTYKKILDETEKFNPLIQTLLKSVGKNIEELPVEKLNRYRFKFYYCMLQFNNLSKETEEIDEAKAARTGHADRFLKETKKYLKHVQSFDDLLVAKDYVDIIMLSSLNEKALVLDQLKKVLSSIISALENGKTKRYGKSIAFRHLCIALITLYKKITGKKATKYAGPSKKDEKPDSKYLDTGASGWQGECADFVFEFIRILKPTGHGYSRTGIYEVINDLDFSIM